MEGLFEHIVSISKAHAYDILAEQVTQLKKLNAELVEACNEGREYIVRNIDTLPDSESVRIKMLIAIENSQNSMFTQTKINQL